MARTKTGSVGPAFDSKTQGRSSRRGSGETDLSGICEDAGLIPGLAQWVKNLALSQAAFGLQMWLGFGVAVAVV